jgi:hypothetical protein
VQENDYQFGKEKREIHMSDLMEKQSSIYETSFGMLEGSRAIEIIIELRYELICLQIPTIL